MVMTSHCTYRRFRLADRVAAASVFVVAFITYMLTLEPTVSYWDCPEYVAVADKLQVGHSPGNPVWMLAARFFINFAPDAFHKALMVNAMSGLFTALAAMLLYRTVTLMLNMGAYGTLDTLRRSGMPRHRLIATVGAGITGALAFTWSDSVWFSAVEAEVYAFSIFLTALTFNVVLHWAFAAYGKAHSGRWLVLAAYLIGAGMGVHELNLLCVPALMLTVWFRVRGHGRSRWWLTWLALAGACILTAAVLFIFIPGFFTFAQNVELTAVNRMHLPFNSGLIAAWVAVTLTLACAAVLLTARGRCRIARSGGIALWCALMFFIGFSSYALIIIRASANPPLNTGAPADIFAFGRYYSREQYGSVPLLRGSSFGAPRLRVESRDTTGKRTYSRYYNTSPSPRYVAAKPGDKALLRNGFASPADSMQAMTDSRRNDDFYLMVDYNFTTERVPEMEMWLPRMHSSNPNDIDSYFSWACMSRADMVRITSPTLAVDAAGKAVKSPDLPVDTLYRPTYLQNFRYMAGYQVGFMYMRYFLWNFVGRQNDFTGHGEPDCGLPVSGITALDSLWTGPTELMPAGAGTDNPGRNIYWFMPLLLGLAGAIWQARGRRDSRRCASAVATLFFLTGVAIVLYLNQSPVQARDRDYAFLGSYYAFCLWIGAGVMPLSTLFTRLLRRHATAASAVAVTVALVVPLQMLSQTADDHDRSGRTATTDMAYNIMTSLPQGAVIFVEGDNSTFPLWYLQSVEEVRRDVRIVCLSYLSDPEYAASLHQALWDAAPLSLSAPESHLRMGRYAYASLPSDTTWRDAATTLRRFYATQSASGFPAFGASRLYVPWGTDTLRIDLHRCTTQKSMVRQELIVLLDIIAGAAAQSPHTPLYWITADGDGIFSTQLLPYMRHEGPVMRLSPGDTSPASLRVASYAESRYRWGGADASVQPYYDPLTAERMTMFRRSLVEHAVSLSRDSATAAEALRLINVVRRRMPPQAVPYRPYMNVDSTRTDEGVELALALARVAAPLRQPHLRDEARTLLLSRLAEATAWERYRAALPPQRRPYMSLLHEKYLLEAPRLRQLLDSLRNNY